MITVHNGATVPQGPTEALVYTFDWDEENLPAGVEIASSTFVIAAEHPDGNAELTADQTSILAGNRSTQVRLSGGTLRAKYRVTNRIVTNETPAQTKARSFFVLIGHR